MTGKLVEALDQPASMPASMFAAMSVKPPACARKIILVLRPVSMNLTVSCDSITRLPSGISTNVVNTMR